LDRAVVFTRELRFKLIVRGDTNTDIRLESKKAGGKKKKIEI